MRDGSKLYLFIFSVLLTEWLLMSMRYLKMLNLSMLLSLKTMLNDSCIKVW